VCRIAVVPDVDGDLHALSVSERGPTTGFPRRRRWGISRFRGCGSFFILFLVHHILFSQHIFSHPTVSGERIRVLRKRMEERDTQERRDGDTARRWAMVDATKDATRWVGPNKVRRREAKNEYKTSKKTLGKRHFLDEEDVGEGCDW
jgi:hypothetical protein